MPMMNERTRRRFGALAAAGVAAALSCTTTPATVWTTSDLYAYDYYYPADVAYYGTYWVDDWYVDPYYYAPARQAQTYTYDAGTTTPDAAVIGGDGGASSDGGTSTAVTSLGTALRALARGEPVCPGAVVVTAKTAQGCTLTGMGNVRTGASINFNGCMLSNGGRIDGMVVYTSTPTASDGNCDANTTVNVTYTAKYSNLAYTAPGGARWVMPSGTDMGSYTRKANAGPTMMTITNNGSLQQYDASNALTANHNFNGMRTYTISRDNNMLTYKVDGGLTVQDVAGGSSVTITGTGITRTASCCRPTAGMLQLTRGDTRATWTFGPSCGQAVVNGMTTTLPACL